MLISYAKEEDIFSILKIDFESFNNHYDEKFYSNKILEKKIIVVKLCEKIIGFIFFDSIFQETEIYKLVIKKNYRNKGIASFIMEFFLDEMKKNKQEKIFLEVREGNEIAINLYKKFDFKYVRKIKNYYSNPTEDAIVMLKEVNNERY